jgi:hypothetical protein
MHVEPPKAPLISLKEFGLHYLMIVLSILTAIGLEEGLRLYHDREAAKAAEQAIEHELTGNVGELRDAIKANRSRLDALRQLGDEVAEGIRQGGDQAALRKKIAEDYSHRLTIGLMFPTIAHDAWDVAVASQAAAHIPREKLEAYTAAYTTERDSLTGANSGMLMLDAPRMTDMLADMEIGQVDPKRFLEVVREAAEVNKVGLGNLAVCEKEMVKALERAGIHLG